jgi:hypothetical protein
VTRSSPRGWILGVLLEEDFYGAPGRIIPVS